MFDPNTFFTLFVQGLYAGALVGLIVGAITWTIADRGTHAMVYIFVALVIGFGFGLAMEGSQLLALVSRGTQGVLESDTNLRYAAFRAFVDVAQWIFGAMALGAAVASMRRAVAGAGLGLVAGTVAAMLVILARGQFRFEVTDSLATIFIAVLSMFFMAVLSVGSAGRE